MGSESIAERARALETWGTARRWRGADPYDALNARRAGWLRRRPLGRRVLTQAVKRSPIDLRSALGIPPADDAAALGAIASAYARNGFLDESVARERLARTLARLDELRSQRVEEPAWGYHFDVQTRVFFYPRGDPNTIATFFAASGFLDAFEATGDEAYLAVAAGSGDFFRRHVPQTEAGDGAYFGYLIGDRTPIHNASMLVAALLARLARHTGRADFADAGQAAVAYTTGLQRADGSWPYGEKPGLEWVDNFHSGYVIESLIVCREAGLDVPEQALGRALEHYETRLFDLDGAPRYTPESRYPIDIQCVAQAVQTLSRAGDPRALQLARRVYRFGLAHMGRTDGAFAFQRRRLWANRTPHVRWGAAPMLLALVHLAAAERDAG